MTGTVFLKPLQQNDTNSKTKGFKTGPVCINTAQTDLTGCLFRKREAYNKSTLFFSKSKFESYFSLVLTVCVFVLSSNGQVECCTKNVCDNDSMHVLQISAVIRLYSKYNAKNLKPLTFNNVCTVCFH